MRTTTTLESVINSVFHVIQAFTRAAQDASLSASDSYRLERAGGAILGMVKS